MNLEILSLDDILKLPSVSLVWGFKRQLPEIPCVYFVIKLPNILLYIGSTKNLYNRFNKHHLLRRFQSYSYEHENNFNYPEVFYLECNNLSEEERFFLEYKYINEYSTIYNKSGTFEDHLKTYIKNLYRFLFTLNICYSKNEIINYINTYAHYSGLKENPQGILSTKNQVFFKNYDTIKNSNQIIFQYEFELSNTLDKELFIKIVNSQIFQHHILPKQFKQEKDISVVLKILVNTLENNRYNPI